jgi:hypothetical protein
VEEKREVSNLRFKDLERFGLGEQKRGSPFNSPAFLSFFTLNKA